MSQNISFLSLTPPERVKKIELLLKEALNPIIVIVKDESDQHIGHVGATAGGHYHVTIVSQIFFGLSRIKRHRLVYDCIGLLKTSGIHALSIAAYTEDEYHKILFI